MDHLQKYAAIFDLDLREVGQVPESNSSEVYRLTLQNGEKVILKIPYHQRKLEREIKVLQRLEGKLPVPRVIDLWSGEDETPGALLLSYIDGVPLSGQVTLEMAYQMGILLAQMHQIPTKKFLSMDETGEVDPDQVWITYKRQAVEESIPFCAQAMEQERLTQCEQLFADYFAQFPPIGGPCLVHNDYRMGNILVRGTDVVGVIDFEIAGGGSADADFSLIKTEVWDHYPGTKETFLAGYSTIRKVPDLERTLPFYELHMAFTRIAWCVRRGKTDEPFYHAFQQQIRQILQTR